MTINEFNSRLNALSEKYHDFMLEDAPAIAGNAAVEVFKNNFEEEGFFGQRWQEVKRRIRSTTKNTTDSARKILTGRTGDLGRSIEVKESGNGRCTIWTNPSGYHRSKIDGEWVGSDKCYADVHNNGGRSGRGAGFTMPRRQFIGNHEKLRATIVKHLEQHIATINQSL